MEGSTSMLSDTFLNGNNTHHSRCMYCQSLKARHAGGVWTSPRVFAAIPKTAAWSAAGFCTPVYTSIPHML